MYSPEKGFSGGFSTRVPYGAPGTYKEGGQVLRREAHNILNLNRQLDGQVRNTMRQSVFQDKKDSSKEESFQMPPRMIRRERNTIVL